MNTLRPLPLLSSRFVFGSSNGAQSILGGGGARFASTEAAVAAAASAPAPPTVPVKGPKPTEEAPKYEGRRSRGIAPHGHGERLWVHNHIMANHIIYSLTPEMKSNKAYRQLFYTGKKLVPGKLRKDYWRGLAVVEFGEGKGLVGRSVFHKLRELQKRHFLEWEDEALLHMSRRARGEALNDQRGNFVADLAAVLAGRGKGNRVALVEGEVVVKDGEQGGKDGASWVGRVTEGVGAASKEVVREVQGVVEVEVAEGEGEKKSKVQLHQATVYWANEQDKYYAEAWTDNVTHVVGLPEKGEEVVVEAEEAAEATEAAKAE